MAELLSCPFCGHAAERKRLDIHVTCLGCGAKGPISDIRGLHNEYQACFLWNFRVKKGMIRPKPEPRYDKEFYQFVDSLD